MKRHISLAAGAMLAFGAVTASADTIGGEIAIGGWYHDPSGWVKYPNDIPDDQSRVDVDDDLRLDEQTDLYLRAKLEHPVPILPNIRLGYVHTETEGDGRIDREITFGDETFSVGTDIRSEASSTATTRPSTTSWSTRSSISTWV